MPPKLCATPKGTRENNTDCGRRASLPRILAHHRQGRKGKPGSAASRKSFLNAPKLGQILVGLAPELPGGGELFVSFGGVAGMLGGEAEGKIAAGISRIVLDHVSRHGFRQIPVAALTRGFGDGFQFKARGAPAVRARPCQGHFNDLLQQRSEEHTSELQSRLHLVCRLLLEKKKKMTRTMSSLTAI